MSIKYYLSAALFANKALFLTDAESRPTRRPAGFALQSIYKLSPWLHQDVQPPYPLACFNGHSNSSVRLTDFVSQMPTNLREYTKLDPSVQGQERASPAKSALPYKPTGVPPVENRTTSREPIQPVVELDSLIRQSPCRRNVYNLGNEVHSPRP